MPKPSRRQALKQRLWQAGAQAIQQLGWPNTVYVCPLCLTPYCEEQLEKLTYEDVAPRAVGGRPLALTCKSGNERAGHDLDADAASFDKIKRLRMGRKVGPFRSPTPMTIDDKLVVNVEIKSTGRDLVKIARFPKNNPSHASRQLQAILEAHANRSAPTLRFDFPTERWSPWKVQLSYLRAAYLAAFARFAYRFAGREVFQKVRDQIRTADRQLIDDFYGWSEGAAGQQVVVVQEPPRIRGVMVLMDEHTVLLPFMDNDQEFYSRVREERGAHDQITVVGRAFGWPSRPTSLLNHATPGQLRAFRGLTHSMGKNEGTS